MILILGITNLCPRSCEYFSAEAGERLIEHCHLPDGEWVLKVKDEELLECPLGKWDQRVARGVPPTAE